MFIDTCNFLDLSSGLGKALIIAITSLSESDPLKALVSVTEMVAYVKLNSMWTKLRESYQPFWHITTLWENIVRNFEDFEILASYSSLCLLRLLRSLHSICSLLIHEKLFSRTATYLNVPEARSNVLISKLLKKLRKFSTGIWWENEKLKMRSCNYYAKKGREYSQEERRSLESYCISMGMTVLVRSFMVIILVSLIWK